MVAVAEPRSIPGHYLPGGNHHRGAASNARFDFAAFVRADAGVVVHTRDFLRNPTALDTEGTVARSAADFVRFVDDHGSGLHNRRAG